MTDRRIVWLGRVTTRAALDREKALAVGPGLLVVGLLVLLPAALFAVIALLERDPDGQVVLAFTLRNFSRLVGFGLLGFSTDHLEILAQSLGFAALTSLFAIALAYPLAFFVRAQGPRLRAVLLAMVVVPMCTNLVVRTSALELVLAPGLPPAELAAWLGLVPPGRGLAPSAFAVLLGLVSNALPFATLPLYAAVERLDFAEIDAARDLYATRARVFAAAILPQTRAALLVAVILTFVPAMGMFVVSDRLGGGRFMLVGNLVAQQFGASRDYPFGAAASLVLVALTLVGLAVYRRAEEGRR